MPTWAWIVIIVVAAACTLGPGVRRATRTKIAPVATRVRTGVRQDGRAGRRKACGREGADSPPKAPCCARHPSALRAGTRAIRPGMASNTVSLRRRSVGRSGGGRCARAAGDERARISDGRLRAACGRHFRRPSATRRALSNRAGIAHANERGEASTEDLRQSVRHYRALFDELLGDATASQPITRDTAADPEQVETEART